MLLDISFLFIVDTKFEWNTQQIVKTLGQTITQNSVNIIYKQQN